MDERQIGKYRVTAELHENKLSVAFKVFEPVNAEEELLAECFVKWDGCSNWRFPGDGYQLHLCGVTQAKEFGTLMTTLYQWAAELMPDQDMVVEQ